MSALVVGYGNVLRSDDGVGCRVAEALADGDLPPGTTVLARHQLTPEIAADVAVADLVVFVDAAVDGVAGDVSTSRVEPAAGSAAWSHHLTPPALLWLAGRLYGHVPAAYAVATGIASVEAGDRLSPLVERTVPRVVEAVLRIVRAGLVDRDGNLSADPPPRTPCPPP